MTASNASDDANGSGLAEYMYFVDNKAGANDTVVRKEITEANPNTATFSTAIGRYLGQVAVVDKAGNVSNVTADPNARTKMYEYALYSISTTSSERVIMRNLDETNYFCLHYGVADKNGTISYSNYYDGEPLTR